jgi:hypothetical protein
VESGVRTTDLGPEATKRQVRCYVGCSGRNGPVVLTMSSSAFDPYETLRKEPTRRRSVVISENMYFLGLTANRRVERDGLRRGGRGPAAWPDIDYVGSEF